MSKTTVHPITVTVAGDPAVEILPATNTTTVHPIAVNITGTDQDVDVKPVE